MSRKTRIFIPQSGHPDDGAFSIRRVFDGRRDDAPSVFGPLMEALEKPEPYGKPLPKELYFRMNPDFPKQNRFYDLAFALDDEALLVSARVKAFFDANPSLLAGNELLPAPLRDCKNKPIDEAFYLMRQFQLTACIDEGKSKGTRWTTAPGYSDLFKIVLDEKRFPRGVHLFRASQITKYLFITEELMRRLIDAGFVGFDYVPVEEWKEDEDRFHEHLVKGAQPAAAAKTNSKTKAKAKGEQAARVIPEELSPFLKAHKNKWLRFGNKALSGLTAWVFDWAALKPKQRAALEETFLDDSAAALPDCVPFAVLLRDSETRPKTLDDAFAMQTEGLLICEAGGAVFYLEGGSRADVARSPARLVIKAR